MYWLTGILLGLCVGLSAHAQGSTPAAIAKRSVAQHTEDTAGTPVTLDVAIAWAQRYNPDYLQTINSRRNASAAQRSAFGAFLPQIVANLNGQYQQGGEQFFNGVALGSNSATMQSAYNIGFTFQLDKASFVTPRVANANRAATESDIAGAQEALRTTVEQQYLTVLQSQDRLVLQDTLMQSAQAQLELAKGRAAVGSGTQLDVQRAEVALGQQQVQRLQAANQLEIDKIKLFQQIGVPQPAKVRLTSTFSLGASIPALSLLLNMARQQNPSVNALRSREHAAALNVSRTKSQYFPSFQLSTGIGGYTNEYRDANFLINQQHTQIDQARESCVRTEEVRAALNLPNQLDQCSSLVFTDDIAAAVRQSNNQFPFNFTPAPRSVTAQISLPLFDGFAREQRVQEAAVDRDNARQAVRSRELALTAEVTTAFLTLQTARQTIALQEQNAAKARQELKFTQDQYAVGIATYVDLANSRSTYAQAESDRINAIYDYHKAFAALENAVGRQLR